MSSNDTFTVIDDTGTVRLSGTAGAPDATAGQVLTAAGDGTAAWDAIGAGSVTVEDIDAESSSAGQVIASNGDGTASWADGAPQSAETIQGSASVAAGSSPTLLTLSHAAGDTLLDYTSPTQPTVITTGTYALTGDFGSDDTHATDAAEFSLTLGGGVNVGTLDLGLPVVSDPPAANVAIVFPVTAGAIVSLAIQHTDLSALNFDSGLYLVRLS